MNNKLSIIVLAAGKGTRMEQDTAKAITETYDGTLVSHVLNTALKLQPEKVIVVTGYKEKEVQSSINEWFSKLDYTSINQIDYVTQKEQLGTGDAVRVALPELKDFNGAVLILAADMPLVRYETLSSLVNLHNKDKATISLITLKGNNKNYFGRIIRDKENRVSKITEFKDCNDQEKLIDETNAALYITESVFLEPAIDSLESNNAQKEFYLTDIIQKAAEEGQTVSSLVVKDLEELIGVNTLQDLNVVNQILMKKKINNLVNSGVNFLNPDSVWIDKNVQIGKGTKIGLNTSLLGTTLIGEKTNIEGNAYIINSDIADNCNIKFSVKIDNAKIKSGASVGPFAHVRPGTNLGEETKIGNFVEVKNTTLGKNSKASHLTYLGDAKIGEDVNIGAGTITCNYDGVNKHETTISDGAFIGSNTSLVAPVVIGKNSCIGAGSTITKNVEDNDLALTRASQKVVKGWTKK